MYLFVGLSRRRYGQTLVLKFTVYTGHSSHPVLSDKTQRMTSSEVPPSEGQHVPFKHMNRAPLATQVRHKEEFIHTHQVNRSTVLWCFGLVTKLTRVKPN